MSLKSFSSKLVEEGLRNKTVVISGGASGIGEGYVRLARRNGANVVFGDLNSTRGEKIAEETGATFVRTDVTVYSEQLKLFREAKDKYSTIDHAIANAGVYEPQNWFDPQLNLESIQEEPSSLVYDVNLRGVTLFAHIASVYLLQDNSSRENRSLTIISSTAGVHCPASTPLYATSKAGLIGLSRSLSQRLLTTHGIRVNTICPSITQTPLAAAMGVLPLFETAGVPVQSADDVAKIIASVNCDTAMNGRILYAIAAKAYDIEETWRQNERACLGSDITEMNKRVLGAALELRKQRERS